MSTVLLSILIVLGTGRHVEAQGMTVTGARVPLPEGNVLGAAFDEDKGMFVVQQTVLSTANNGLRLRSHLQLSSWNLKTLMEIRRKVSAEAPEDTSPFPCGRVASSFRLQRVLLCSAGSNLELVDPDSLETVGTMANADDHVIRDFAVDDQHGRIFVVSSRRGGAVVLATYSMANGAKEHESTLGARDWNASGSWPPRFPDMMGISLALDPRSEQAAVVVNVTSHSRTRTDVYTCSAESELLCGPAVQVDKASQIVFFEGRLLLSLAGFADDKKDCILTIDPATRSVSRGYCSVSTGVHYAVGVVQDKFVTAFTGVSKHHGWLRADTSEASSFSVWRAGSPRIVAAVQSGVDYEAFDNQIRIIGSSSAPIFIAYRRLTNILSLYAIGDVH